MRSFGTGEISAAELAASLLERHPDYGDKQAEKVASALIEIAKTASSARRMRAADWIAQAAAQSQPGVMITARSALVGLALVEQTLRQTLLAGGFLERIAGETQDGYPSAFERLTVSARAAFAALTGSERSGSTDTISDAPAREDALGRRAFASVLADRIRRMRQLDPASTLVVHLDGPWGSGKSSVLNFLADELRDASGQRRSRERWLVLGYNAWQQQRIERPWWTLSELVAAGVSRNLAERWSCLAWLRHRVRHFWFRTFAGRGAVLLAALAATALSLALIYAMGVQDMSTLLGGTKSVEDKIKTVTAIVTLGLAIFTIVLAAFRFLTGDDGSAQHFLQSRPDPINALVAHVGRLLKRPGRPTVILVDDIDRCDGPAVVRLLEGIHTVFGTLPVVFVVAGDGRWIARAFEKAYADDLAGLPGASDVVGKPLGTLFLEKIFQFSAVVPEMPPALKRLYWRSLLKQTASDASTARSERAAQAGRERSAAVAMRGLRSEQAVLAAVAAVDPASRPDEARAVREAAMRRLAEADLIDKPADHVLELFEAVVEPNPRAMKRQIMAYGMARASDLASFRNTGQQVLATWSVLSLRWPALADWLADDPEGLERARSADADAVEASDRDRRYSKLLRSAELRRLVDGDSTRPPLTAADVRRVTGKEPASGA